MTAVGGGLNLGHILSALGVTDVDDVLVLRHTPSEEISKLDTVTAEQVRSFTRWQSLTTVKFPRQPAGIWLVFFADGGRRSRFHTAYVNRGELVEDLTEALRFFDLHPSPLLEALAGRLVIEWSRDAINWAKSGAVAAAFPVVEIADPNVVEFPGFDNVCINHEVLQAVIGDSRYAQWRTALAAVQGIYCIADTTNGKLYVGKADGHERLLGRWAAYARDGHGGNDALRELAGLDPSHARHFMFSILRVFGPTAIASEVDTAEAHYKRALLTRAFGYNRN
jgi:hypothetical protein